jgi:serine/threonine protein kinase
MGTPGYMAPEQARGEPLDTPADVFALGSMLATILTSRPAFVGTSVMETIQKASAADLADVLARLDACGADADADLIAIAKRCLSADRESRPSDGRVVATEVAAYRAGVETRLRQAETERAESAVWEGEQRKRRRVEAWAGGIIAA